MILADSSAWGGTLIIGVLVLALSAVAYLMGRARRAAGDIRTQIERDRLKDEKELRDSSTGDLVDLARRRGILSDRLGAKAERVDDDDNGGNGEPNGAGPGPPGWDEDPDR